MYRTQLPIVFYANKKERNEQQVTTPITLLYIIRLYNGVIFVKPMNNIVAIETKVNNDVFETQIYQREKGKLTSTIVDFNPWLISAQKCYKLRGQSFSGNLDLKHFYSFDNFDALSFALKYFFFPKRLYWTDLNAQFFAVNSDIRLFKNMQFNELVRMQLDIECTGLNPEVEHIILVAIKCNDIEFTIGGDEKTILTKLTEAIQMIDPDVIEGHNIFGFDLPFIIERARRNKVALNWGRDESPLFQYSHTRNFRIGSHTLPFKNHTIWGRHIIDTQMVAMRYDANSSRSFDSYGLKHLAEVFGVQVKDRLILERDKLSSYKMDEIETYAMHDVIETAAICEKMIQPEFYLSTILPDTFQNVITGGNATKINQLLVSDYIQRGHSIPLPPKSDTKFEGAYVDCRMFGVFDSVSKVDVASLYPSIMINLPVEPEQDQLHRFMYHLRRLTKRRLDAKAKEKTVTGFEKEYLHGIQQAYKILINSFYGYLGANMNFSSVKKAALVTATGRDIVSSIADQLEAMGTDIIEIDTDGVYFQHKKSFNVQDAIDSFDLPKGIVVEHEKTYDTMISVSKKNYVLFTKKDGKLDVSYHGNSLRSRRDEPFGQKAIHQICEYLYYDKPELIQEYYDDFVNRLLTKNISGEDIAKRERISEKTMTSSMKTRIKNALKETHVVGDYVYLYDRNDGSLGLLEDFDADYDVLKYLKKFYAFVMRLEPVLNEYNITLWKPNAKEFKIKCQQL